MKKVLSVRIDDVLFTKVCNHEMKNADLVSKALYQYFRDKKQSANSVPVATTDFYTKAEIDSKVKEITELMKECLELVKASKIAYDEIHKKMEEFNSATILWVI